MRLFLGSYGNCFYTLCGTCECSNFLFFLTSIIFVNKGQLCPISSGIVHLTLLMTMDNTLVVLLTYTCISFSLIFIFSFILNQSQSMSVSYDLIIKDELGLEESDAVYVTNLPVFPLHFLKVPNTVYSCSHESILVHCMTQQWFFNALTCVVLLK